VSVRRLWPVLLLVPLGMVTGHEVAYAALHSRASGLIAHHGHGHLELLSALAVPLAAAGALRLARRSARERILPAVASLAGAQVIAFVAMEAAERLAAGGDVTALARSPLLWVGLAAQTATAFAVALGVRGAGRATTVVFLRVATVMAAVPHALPALRPAGQPAPRRLAVSRWLLRRGPPGLLGP
jgi:hypothetical protein